MPGASADASESAGRSAKQATTSRRRPGRSAMRASAAAPRAFVQKGDGEIASGGSVSVGFTRANKSGNAIVGFVVWDNPGSVSLTDSNGNAYQTTPVGPASSGDGSLRTQIFYARGIASG